MFNKLNLLIVIFILLASIVKSQTITSSIVPQYIQGHLIGTTTNLERVPFAFWVQLDGLQPNHIYKYYTQADTSAAINPSGGAGNCIIADATNFKRLTNPGSGGISTWGVFTASATGTFKSWFILEPTGNVRFTTNFNVYPHVALRDSTAGETTTTRISIQQSVEVLCFDDPVQTKKGSAFWDSTLVTDKSFMLLYDNTTGTGRPIAGSFIESDGIDLVGLNAPYAAFYKNFVDNKSGFWGAIVPNELPNGIKRLEYRDFSTGAINTAAVTTSTTGIWPSGTNTVNPSNGSSGIKVCSLCGVAPTVIDGGTSSPVTQVQNCTLPASYPLQIVINNYGTGNLTTASINYKVNNGSVVSQNFSGNIVPSGNTSFSFTTPLTGLNVDGTYIVKVWINLTGDTNQSNDTSIITVTNLVDPTVDIIANPTSGNAPLIVNFSANTGASIYALSWNFPGGLPASSSSLTPTVNYNNPGTYEASVTLTISGTNCIANDTVTITVNAAANDAGTSSPVTNIQDCDLPASYPMQIIINNYGTSDITNATVSYNVNGSNLVTENFTGSIVPSANSLFSFNSSITGLDIDGTYIVKVWVDLTGDTNNFNDTTTVTIINLATPTVSIVANPTSGIAPLTVNYSVNTTATAYTLNWNFPGGSPSTSSSLTPSISYANPGNYDAFVSLTINGTSCAASDSAIAVVSVISNVTEAEAVNFSLFPNPANDLVNISTDIAIDRVEVLNIQGKILQQIDNLSSAKNIKLDMNAYTAGIYFVRIISNNSIGVEKLIIK